MTKDIVRDDVAALLAERDLLRARLAKMRHHKTPYPQMSGAEYSAALKKLGLSRYANGTSPTRSRSCFAWPSSSASRPRIRQSDLRATFE